ncbi:hypothetical protein FHX15_006029 [Rhizobium sp. BK650]|uniref:hypothetical protein n=1 Tax=Rhizobium sp. BK650 TaxID=2586990 RepID=UPI0017B9E52E|nr:hypothetical protein [Rhizobium sp. BK650]
MMERIVYAVILAGLAGVAYAHQAPSGFQYSAFCCNGDGESGDCQPIPSQDVKIHGANYEFSLKPGDHRLATHGHLFSVPQSKAMMSMDGFYHLCLFPNEDVVRCFYAPQMNF